MIGPEGLSPDFTGRRESCVGLGYVSLVCYCLTALHAMGEIWMPQIVSVCLLGKERDEVDRMSSIDRVRKKDGYKKESTPCPPPPFNFVLFFLITAQLITVAHSSIQSVKLTPGVLYGYYK